MNEKEKEIATKISHVEHGLYSLFLLFWILAGDEYLADLPFQQAVVMTVIGLTVCLGILSYGILGLKRQKLVLKVERDILFAELIPGIVGFTLLGFAVYYFSIFALRTTTFPGGQNYHYYYHPYSTQSFIMFLTGSAIVMISYAINYYLLPKQILQTPVDTCPWCGAKTQRANSFCNTCGKALNC